VKGDPADGVVADQTGRHHELGEPAGIYALVTVAVEIDALATEEVDGVGGVGVTGDVEVGEVELPDEAVMGTEIGEVTKGVGKGEADLDEVEGVDVGFEEEVVIGGSEAAHGGVQLRRGTKDEAGEFGVHGDEREVVDEVPDELELGFQVVGPDFPDCYGFGFDTGTGTGISVRVDVEHGHRLFLCFLIMVEIVHRERKREEREID